MNDKPSKHVKDSPFSTESFYIRTILIPVGASMVFDACAYNSIGAAQSWMGGVILPIMLGLFLSLRFRRDIKRFWLFACMYAIVAAWILFLVGVMFDPP